MLEIAKKILAIIFSLVLFNILAFLAYVFLLVNSYGRASARAGGMMQHDSLEKHMLPFYLIVLVFLNLVIVLPFLIKAFFGDKDDSQG